MPDPIARFNLTRPHLPSSQKTSQGQGRGATVSRPWGGRTRAPTRPYLARRSREVIAVSGWRFGTQRGSSGLG